MGGEETSIDQHGSAQIASHAYYKAEQRGFVPGYELDDWLEAEQEYLMDKSNSPQVRSSLKSMA